MLKTYCVKMSIVRRASLSALCSLSGHGSVLQAASSSYRKTEATTLSTRTQFVRHNKINQKNYIYIYICSWLADLPYHRHASYKEWWCRDSEFSNQGWETPTRCQFLEAKKKQDYKCKDHRMQHYILFDQPREACKTLSEFAGPKQQLDVPCHLAHKEDNQVMATWMCSRRPIYLALRLGAIASY